MDEEKITEQLPEKELPEEERGKGAGRKRGRKKGRKRGLLDVIILLIFLAGLSIMLYPKVSDFLNRLRSRKDISGYEREISGISDAEYEALFRQAREYNQRLKQNPNPFSVTSRTEGYEETLRLGDSGIMGIVTIDSIHVRLPFYHGTEEEVLQTAVGHLEGSSLPIGEVGDHAVLSAHRGLPSAELFTDLSRVQVGDTFVITVLNREMTYQVDQILTVLPNEMEALERDEGLDLVTLITCTPYGINTHRLLVRGRRIS